MASRTENNPARRGAALLLTALLATVCSLFTLPTTSRADATEELQAVQQQIQSGNETYEEANARVEELQAQIDANEARIAEIEATLPEARERAASSMSALYKMQQQSGSLIELLLSSDTFNELLTTIQYLDVIQSHNSESLEQLAALSSELEVAQANLDVQMKQAEAARQTALDALDEANAARTRLEEEIAAQAAAEEAERQAAIEAAQRAAEEAARLEREQQEEAAKAEDTFTTESGGEAQVEVPSNPDAGSVDWGSDKVSFVSEWTRRIDAYLAGSPLAGYGATFAEAAWDYGVDPRFSPAIAMVESSLGRVCFRPHNAWGWGSSSWSSWEEAIPAHVRGLASGYGGQLTYAAAKKYCPPNADHWYASVLANMEKI